MAEVKEMEKLPEGWKRVRLGDVLDYEQPQRYIVKSEKYDDRHGTPVLTPGKAFILGFTDETTGIFEEVPVIIFDDFTTESRYVIFPFKVKSSALKVLKLKDRNSNLYFLYNIMQILNFKPGSEHKRFWISEYSKINILIPPLPEQRKIAEILETIDNAIEKTDKIIEKYKRIKQGMMQDLFTKGITAFGFGKDKLINAVKKAFKNGDHNFGREENLINHLSDYLREVFSEWNVDSEIEKNKERQRPDIIIHKRNTNENLFAIEVKKSEDLNRIKEDIKKLEDLMLKEYRYEDAVFIGFNIENFDRIFELSEKVNFILISKDGEVKIRNRVRRFKDSPLGRIPEEWEVVELGEVAEILLSNVDKKIFSNEAQVKLCNYLDVYQNDYITLTLNFAKGSVNKNEYQKFKIDKGDVIITKDSETFDDIAKPAFVKDEIPDLICGYHLCLLKPRNIDGLFLAKILLKDTINKHFQKLANGITRFGIAKETIQKAKIPLPSLPEQHRIASILSQIDQTIEKEKKYKEKLERIKQGLMEDLLTGKVRVNRLIKEGEANE